VYIQEKLGYSQPLYCHLSIALNSVGKKFSKQHVAEDVLLVSRPEKMLFNVLKFLGQEPDSSLRHESVKDIIN